MFCLGDRQESEITLHLRTTVNMAQIKTSLREYNCAVCSMRKRECMKEDVEMVTNTRVRKQRQGMS